MNLFVKYGQRVISSPNLRVSYYLSTTRHRRAKKVMNHGEREISDFNQSGNWFWNEPLYVHTYLFQI